MIYFTKQCDAAGRAENELVYPVGWHPREHPIFGFRIARLPEERFLPNPRMSLSDDGSVHDPALFPPWVKFKKHETFIQDVYYMHGWYIFSTRLRNRIEEMEPGVHRFIPIRLLQSDGSEVGDSYHVFNVCAYFFSIDVAKSPCYVWRLQSEDRDAGLKMYRLAFDHGAKPGRSKDGEKIEIVHRSAVVGGHMFWRERLDLNVEPNTGEWAWVKEENGDTFMRFVTPTRPAEWNIYSIPDDYGFRARGAFKTWFESEGLTGLNFVTPGCLDTELEETGS